MVGIERAIAGGELLLGFRSAEDEQVKPFWRGR